MFPRWSEPGAERFSRSVRPNVQFDIGGWSGLTIIGLTPFRLVATVGIKPNKDIEIIEKMVWSNENCDQNSEKGQYYKKITRGNQDELAGGENLEGSERRKVASCEKQL